MQAHIQDFLDDVKSSKSEGTHRSRLSDLRPYDAYLEEKGLEATEVEPKHIHQYLREKGEVYADATVESYYSSLKLLYDFLAGVWDVMDESPFESDYIERKNYSGNGKDKQNEAEIVYVTPDEKELMCENTGPEYALRDELLIRLLFQAGLRRGEAATIKLVDIDRDAREIEIYSDKTDSHRTVYYRPSLDFLLDQWIDGGYRDAETSSEYLFPTGGSEHLSGDRINMIVKQAAENAGIQEVIYVDAAGKEHQRITAHALRHGHGVEALKSGVDTRFIQKHLGHQSIETTEKYLQVIDEDVRTAMQKFGTRAEA